MSPNLEFGYWYLFERQTRGLKSITHIREYKGEPDLHLVITQLDLTSKEQTRIVNEWCAFLKNEKLPVTKIWTFSRMSQKIFDAICHQTQLEGLWIKWGVYPDISGLRKLENLKYLHLGGGASIEDISPVHGLTDLISFESSHLYKIHDYSFLSKMTNLVDLLIEGDPYGSMKKLSIKSLKFLEDMPQIIRLSLCMMKVEDHSYLPISKIKSLKYLSLPNDRDLDKDKHLFENFLPSN